MYRKKQHILETGIAFSLILFFTLNYFVFAAPVNPSITIISNSTMNSPTSGTIINTSGGSITTVTLDVTAQNLKWKAYVGNVSGNLVLQDSGGYNVYDWGNTLSVTGEVYATRSSGTINWSGINCSNTTHIYNEEVALNHTTNPNDNISNTFNVQNHTQFMIGTIQIPTNDCYSIHTFVNNQTQNDSFEEIILYDGTNATNGAIVYATNLESGIAGFNNDIYNFQMIVPDVALDTWTSSTAYYFYVEIT